VALAGGTPQKANHFVFVLNVADGSQVVAPVLVQGTREPRPTPARCASKQRSSLVLTNVGGRKTIFLASGTVQETGNKAAGWIFAFDCATNTVAAALATSQGEGAGIWMGGQVAGQSAPSEAMKPVGGGMRMSLEGAKLTLVKKNARGVPMLLVYPQMPTGTCGDEDWGSAGPACIFAIGVCIATGKDGIAYPIKVVHMGGTTPTDLKNPKANCKKLAAPPVMKSWTIFAWGENAQLHKWAIGPTGALKYVAQSNEYASADVRANPPGGMPGGFCAGSSNGADPGQSRDRSYGWQADEECRTDAGLRFERESSVMLLLHDRARNR
jgi:hypothetical protein